MNTYKRLSNSLLCHRLYPKSANEGGYSILGGEI